MEGKYPYKSMFFFVESSMLRRRDEGAKKGYAAFCSAGSMWYPVVNNYLQIKNNFAKILTSLRAYIYIYIYIIYYIY